MKDDGGPAFPTQNTSPGYCGLSKREFYAAMAMQGTIVSWNYKHHDLDLAEVVRASFKIADAMIAATKGADDE